MLWITGLNTGIPSNRVAGAATASNLRAASFLFGLDADAVLPAPAWEWQRARPLADIAGGFRRALTFDDSTAAGSSSISRNGLWLQAIVMYEDLLHPSTRGATPEELAEQATGMRVASVVASDASAGATATITVVDADGSPLAGTLVSATWIGAKGTSQPPEEAILEDACRTVAGGSCSLTLEGDEIPGSLPVRLLITNLEHERHAFVPGEGVLPAPTVFD
jgi:hypothetical protein